MMRAGSRGLLTDPKVLFSALIIIPIIHEQLHAVLISVIVRFPLFPKAELEGAAVHPLPGTFTSVIAEADPGELILSDVPVFEECCSETLLTITRWAPRSSQEEAEVSQLPRVLEKR